MKRRMEEKVEDVGRDLFVCVEDEVVRVICFGVTSGG